MNPCCNKYTGVKLLQQGFLFNERLNSEFFILKTFKNVLF